MAKRKRMDQIKAIIQTYVVCKSIKQTARQLNVSKNTVRTYVRRAQAHHQDLTQVLALDESAFHKLFIHHTGDDESSRQVDFMSRTGYFFQELKRVGVTRQLLWQEYREEYPHGYGYSQFCEHLRRAALRKDLTLSLEHQPGEVLMLDFAGKKMHWVDPYSGEVHASEVLIGVLPFSQYSFCIALPSQGMEDFVYGIFQCLAFLGALPQVILSDNLKAYVTRPDRYTPTFTQLCEQLAAHYQVELRATRPGKPKDKASVENAVQQVYRRIYGPLRNQVFHSLESLNEAISKELMRHNQKSYQKLPGNRQASFERDERPAMRDLPADHFEIKKITRAKVQRNYHVFLGEEKNYYSVPYPYVGEQAEVVYTRRIVEVYIKHERVATHQRLFLGGNEYRHQTDPQHMPRNHQEWKEAQGYDGAYFLAQAARIGPATEWAVQQVLLGRIHEAQTYNSCKGILALAKKYSPLRMERAAERCRAVEKVTYVMLKRILEHNLDQSEQSTEQRSLGLHQNVRGAEYYQ